MNKIILIIQREYLTRVRKRSFLIMTLLGPLLFGLISILPIYVSVMSKEGKQILIADESNTLQNTFINNSVLSFQYTNISLDEALALLQQDNHYTAIVHIPKTFPSNTSGIVIYASRLLNQGNKAYIEQLTNKRTAELQLETIGFTKDKIQHLLQPVTISQVSIDQNKPTAQLVANVAIGTIAAVLIFTFIFVYGMQVMRGVMEEKTNRIVEVIISSVKPFQLMTGKIVGIALVSLTQFMIWLILTASITIFINERFQLDRFNDQNIASTMEQIDDKEQAMEMHNFVSVMDAINFAYIIPLFLFYFLFGYLLYSALFAAIGSTIDQETDSQQFTLPVTIPLLTSFMFATTVAENPDSPLAFWLSMIPLTSPVTMMIRIPMGVSTIELVSSMIFLVVGFFFFTWLAARIYKTGILNYGKKASWSDLWIWMSRK